MQDTKNIVAFDCGNSSIRVILGRFDGKRIESSVVHQVEHAEIKVDGLYYWDVLHIFCELQKGLQKAHAICRRIDSAGICTWGIDFGMIGRQGQLIANPLCYRNSLGGTVLGRMSDQERRFMFDETGIHNHQMNSLYQLAAYKEVFGEQLAAVRQILLMPDLLAYLFTGQMRGERSIASTTQYYSVIERAYSLRIIQRFTLEASLFPALIDNGETIGMLRSEIANNLKINTFAFICVPSHDTACAVAAVPAEEEDFIFVSSGTWGLIGTELRTPIVNDAVYNSGLANEGGAFDTTTLLKNSAGMFIIQRIRNELSPAGKKLSWDEIVTMAKSAIDELLLFDPNHESLYNPVSMIEAIRSLLQATGQNGQCGIDAILRAVYESMALSYRSVVDQLIEVTSKQYASLYIIGGGSNNAFLNQLAANATGLKVVAGPAEATSLGNMGVQLFASGQGENKLAEIRRIIRQSVQTVEYWPDHSGVAEKYKKYAVLLNR